MSTKTSDVWDIGGVNLTSRMFLGTARYPSPRILQQAVIRSGAQVVTVSLRREMAGGNGDRPDSGERFFDQLRGLLGQGVRILPNTAGCRTAREAITTARMARDLFDTCWIKLEVIGDDFTLQPDPFGLVEAASELVKDGFEVFPYTTEDLVVGERLLAAGCRILMPWGAPIGSGRGLANVLALKAYRARFPGVPLLVDAGVGRPSHAAQAMELGFDGVLLNTAVARADDPPLMAEAFATAIDAGRKGYLAGLMEGRERAVPSTPVVGQAFT